MRSLNGGTFHRQRGGLSTLAAVTLLLAIVMMALALDSGRLYLQERKLRDVVDMAALAAAQQSGLCGDLDPAPVVADIARWHGYDGSAFADKMNVHLGYLTSRDDGVRQFHPSQERPEAVWLDATLEVPASLVAGGLFGRTVELRSEAVARRVPNLTFSAGSGFVMLDTRRSALLGALLGGIDLNLDLLTTQGLANARLSLGDLVEAVDDLGLEVGIASVERLLELDLTLAEALRVYIRALESRDFGEIDISLLRQQLLKADYEGMNVRLGRIINVTMPDPIGKLRSEIRAMDLLWAMAYLVNQNHAIELSNILDLDPLLPPGISQPTILLSIVEPPKLAAGPPGQGTVARSAQTRLQIGTGITLGADSHELLDDVLTLDLNLAIEAVVGEAEFAHMECPRRGQPYRAEIMASSTLLRLRVGTFQSITDSDEVSSSVLALNLGGLEVASLNIDIPGAPPQEEILVFEFDDPRQMPAPQFVSNRTGGRIGDFFQQATIELQVLPAVDLPILSGLIKLVNKTLELALRGVVDEVLVPLLNQLGGVLLEPLLETLGLEVGGVQVELLHLEEGETELLL